MLMIFLLTAVIDTSVFAQQRAGTVQGSVFDKKTEKPLPSATIFLSGTTIGTVSDAQGNFILRNVPPGIYELVVRFLGFEQIVMPFEMRSNGTVFIENIHLRPGLFSLGEITVESDRDRQWYRQLRMFERSFIGQSENAELTQIVNPEFLDFEYSRRSQILSATAVSELHIINNALGYELYTGLGSFNVDTRHDTGSYFHRTRFVEMEADDKDQLAVWKQNRESAILGSINHFISCLINGLERDIFTLENGSITHIANRRATAYGGSITTEQLVFLVETEKNEPLRIKFNNRIEASLELPEFPLLLVNRYGDLMNPQEITIHGDWAARRVADRLPSSMYRCDAPTALAAERSAETSPLNRQVSLINATKYIDRVAVEDLKGHFESATNQYISSLSSSLHTEADINLLRNEISFFRELLNPDQAEQLESVFKENPKEAGQLFGRLWKTLDPTPLTNTNERLIEHRVRIHEARKMYADEESVLGVDGRGLIYIKYGEPDQIIDRPININRGEIQEFVKNFYLERGGGSIASIWRSVNITTDHIIEYLYMNPFSSTLNIWIYQNINLTRNESVAFYFSEQKNDVFKRVTSIDSWFPTGTYRTPRNLPFAPVLPLQYITYQRLMHEDRIFMDGYNRLEFEIFDNIQPRSGEQWKQLARNLKTNTNHTEIRRQLQAAPEQSSQANLIPTIETNVYQYRSFNNLDEPILITFFESYPTAAFLMDLTRNNESMVADTEESGQILSLISEWYSLQQGIELYNTDMIQVGRIRDRPMLVLETDTSIPTVSVVDIPFIEEDASQFFYSKLYNYHPETEPSQPSLFPDELRGIGRDSATQSGHLQPDEENGLLMSDLIFGYNLMLTDDIRYPFIIKHDRIIPEDVNPVVHFEIFGLEQDEAGFSSFEIEYDFRPQRGFLSFLRRTSEHLSGTVEFTTASTKFRESLEFDNLMLTRGEYTLTLIVRDLQSGRELSRELEFSVEEGDQFTISAN